ncbi:zf-HC2 domain-containing protein [Microbacterium rhizosphaerae]|uniref:Zf-HC2 domain-containing protein n=1 Tax=Microbacterium rhizosphaerae TaxID=1678237 RepID=A0ABZ0SIW8_9MICO|nr:zf-HC2 domain-containing protein [Microbacterium rhizosphaerae]WPR88528.1 zf-HC2 domain-containing protein [Microbacterium rhizosphaerae]
MTDRFAEWDAAYLIGALSPADRAAFEEHMETCAECRAAVAALAPTVGLLSRVRADAFAEDTGTGRPSAEPGPAARSALVERARAAERRRRALRFGLALAAAVVVVAAVALPLTLGEAFEPRIPQAIPTATALPSLPPAEAMQPLTKAPLTASVRLQGVAWGTKIDLSCRYAPTYGTGGADHVYALAVVGTDGSTTQLSTWKVLAGKDAHLSAGTALDTASIRAVQILDASGKVLMTYSP